MTRDMKEAAAVAPATASEIHPEGEPDVTTVPTTPDADTPQSAGAPECRGWKVIDRPVQKLARVHWEHRADGWFEWEGQISLWPDSREIRTLPFVGASDRGTRAMQQSARELSTIGITMPLFAPWWESGTSKRTGRVYWSLVFGRRIDAAELAANVDAALQLWSAFATDNLRIRAGVIA